MAEFTIHGLTPSMVNAACAKALAKGTWRLRDVRTLLTSHETQAQLPFAQHHPLIRHLSEYGTFIKTHRHPNL